MTLKSVDSETTGIDLHHGSMPFAFTICNEKLQTKYWEWDVDPVTRRPTVPQEDVEEIQAEIDEADELVLQNAKFDVTALDTILPAGTDWKWPWSKTYDTLLGAHLLNSNQPKDLTTLAIIYLGINIKPYEDEIERITKQALSLVKDRFPEWRIAKKGLPELPSAKEKLWKFDMWVPRQVALELDYPEDHEWFRALPDYMNTDSTVTVGIHKAILAEVEARGLLDIFEYRRKIARIPYIMENVGITFSEPRKNNLYEEYVRESSKAGDLCKAIAKHYDYDLNLPKSGNNKSLTKFVFEVLKLDVVKKSKKTGAPSLDKTALEHYQATLREKSKELLFVTSLRNKRKRDTAISYVEGYDRYKVSAGRSNWYRLYPSLNSTGTDTLRWSSSNPNEQNISKQEGFNLRYCFGPAPGREWWSSDAKNIELRLPAYEAEEEEMIALFERPNDPPYFGSYHLLVFDTLHPEKFAKHGKKSKDVYESTWYQWTKNGNFAVQYGAVEASGTADRAYHVEGAQRRIQDRFSRISKLNSSCIAFANEHGYIETMPDKYVDPSRGYPLQCTRTKWGGILPTVPLNYHIQGTAMWWMTCAMLSCQEYLDYLNEKFTGGYYMIMQVHDELVFDFPKGKGKEPWKTNLPKMRKIKSLMESGGERIGIPTPVSLKYHAANWSEGISL